MIFFSTAHKANNPQGRLKTTATTSKCSGSHAPIATFISDRSGKRSQLLEVRIAQLKRP